MRLTSYLNRIITFTILLALLLCNLLLPGCKKNEPVHNEIALYTEAHRPQFHFSPQQKWMNDPNGMFYYDGEYHLFYQYYPDSTVWGPMHWGHAISRDMVHWEHLPVALYPDENGWIFSGSAVVDWQNTSGLGQNGQPPLIAIFTYHNDVLVKAGREDYQTQGIAYSNDRGRTWTKYLANPVLPNPGIRDFRDPKVFWYETGAYWVMSLAVENRISFYTSPDLLNWTHASDFGQQSGAHGGVWECPDLFSLTVEGTNQTKWVLLVSINPGGPNGGSATQYFIGDFDGKTFTNDHAPATTLWIDHGRDNYAGVTWSDIPAEDGRRLFIGWMSNWHYANEVPTERWRSAMTLPRTLTLRTTPAGLRLCSQPVQEMTQLRGPAIELDAQIINGKIDISKKLNISTLLMEMRIEIEMSDDATADFGVALTNARNEVYRIGYDAGQGQFYSDRTRAGKQAFSELFANQLALAPRVEESNTVILHLFLDVASAELFADDGATALTEIFFPNEDFTQLQLYSNNGTVQLKKATFYPLLSVWQ